jgi:hypothetical protein
MLSCRSCGATNPPDAASCRVCGRNPSTLPTAQGVLISAAVPPPAVLRQPATRPTPGRPPLVPLAVAAVVLGGLGWLLLPVLGAVAAVVCGHLALRQFRRSPTPRAGRSLAIAGLVLGYLQLAVLALLAFGVGVFFAVTYLLFQLAAIG